MHSIKSVSWNFIAAIWMAIIMVVATPLYVSKLGLDLYAIIAIWFVSQTVMNFFDFGLGATLTKEFSTGNFQEEKSLNYSNTLRTIEIVYWSISAICVVLFILITNFFFNEGIILKFSNIEKISSIMLLMFMSLFFQFPNILYINGLIGLQRHRLVSILQIVGNTLKFGSGVLIFLNEADLVAFFNAQIIIAMLQTFTSRHFLRKRISGGDSNRPYFDFQILRKISNFSKHMALTSLLAVAISNLDRLFVFKLLSSKDLSLYSLAFTITGFLQLAIQPFYRSFFPLYSELFSKGQQVKLERVYFYSNKIISLLIIPMAIICFVFARQIFFVWMGNIDPSIVMVFRVLIVGVMFAALGWLPAAYQQAIGWPELHVKIMLLSLVLAIPVLIFSIQYFGLIGASFNWWIHGILDLTLGLWIMHKTVLKGKLKHWYFDVFLPPFLYGTPVALISIMLIPQSLNRINTFVWVVITSLISFSVVAYRIRKIIFMEKNIENGKSS